MQGDRKTVLSKPPLTLHSPIPHQPRVACAPGQENSMVIFIYPWSLGLAPRFPPPPPPLPRSAEGGLAQEQRPSKGDADVTVE